MGIAAKARQPPHPKNRVRLEMAKMADRKETYYYDKSGLLAVRVRPEADPPE
jgi:hypothetical protein